MYPVVQSLRLRHFHADAAYRQPLGQVVPAVYFSILFTRLVLFLYNKDSHDRLVAVQEAPEGQEPDASLRALGWTNSNEMMIRQSFEGPRTDREAHCVRRETLPQLYYSISQCNMAVGGLPSQIRLRLIDLRFEMP